MNNDIETTVQEEETTQAELNLGTKIWLFQRLLHFLKLLFKFLF